MKPETAFGKKTIDGRTSEHKPFIIYKRYDSIDQCENIGPEICTLVKTALTNPDIPLEVDHGQVFIRVELAFQVGDNTLPASDHYRIEMDGSITVGGEAEAGNAPVETPEQEGEE